MKSHSFQTLRTLLLFAALTGAASAPVYAFGHKAPPVRPAGEYPAFDTHPQEHVTIAIDPCTEQSDCDFFRLPYIRHSMIPVRVIITNDSNAALKLDDVRMQFISSNGDKLPAANLDDLNRRLFSTKAAAGKKSPIVPFPLPMHHAAIDKKITEDDDDFGFKTTTVAAHSTVGGYLFYDIKDLDSPPLKGAQIYVKMIRTADGKELFAFSIPFNKWLATQKGK